jgi:hypothetical protein
MHKKFMLIAALLLLAAGLSAGDQPGPIIERVDDGVPGYDATGIAQGRLDEVYVAAIKGRELLIYTCRPNHVAEPRRIARLGSHPVLATDVAGNLHAAYLDPEQKTLNYATNQSGSWMTMTVDANVADVTPSLAIDVLGRPHVAYVADDEKKTLRHSVYVNETWKAEPIETLGWASGNISLAIDVRGKLHLSYFNGGEKLLKYATNSDGAWKSSAVISPLATYGPVSSLAIDSRGCAHIAYFVTDPASNHNLLMYASNAAGPWTFAQVDKVSQVNRFLSLAVDLPGHAHVSYFDEAAQQLRYAANTSGEWKDAVVDKIHGMGLWAAMVLGSAGDVHVSYLGESSLWHACFPQGYGSAH